MEIKHYIKKIARAVFGKETIVRPNIVSLAPNQLLKDRTAIITGGSSGIGYEIARAFIDAGAIVIITGRNSEKLAQSCELLNKRSNGRCFWLQMDNKDVSCFEKKFNEAMSLVPGKKIDILVNNAGVLTYETISTENETTYDSVLDTNLKAPFFLCQLFGHYLIDNQIKGNILNIASSSSLRPASTAYTLTKWGLRGLTLGLARMLAPYGITVNGLAPGQTLSNMVKGVRSSVNISNKNVPLGRFILPEEIANMAVILVSEMGRAILGDIVYMTGGAGNLTYEDMNYDFK